MERLTGEVLPTGSLEELEAGVAQALADQRALLREQKEVGAHADRALSGGTTKDAPGLLARRAALPAELAAVEVRVRQARAGLLQQLTADAAAKTPALVKDVVVAEGVVRRAERERARAIEALRCHQVELQQAQSALNQLRRLFAEHIAQYGGI
ncbi:MAG: hypothetical protein M3N28_05110 [Actinomycetota bacterium]|nr:hypothetical protein [Actinomycetota bacterium]